MWKSIGLIFFCFLPICAIAQNRADTFRIYFDLDVSTLNTQGTKVLDSLLYYDIISPTKNVLIIGYADNLGSNKYNDRLSENRADNVKHYLTDMHLPAEQIKLCIGTGEVARTTEKEKGYAQDRKVDIVVNNVQLTPSAKINPKEKVVTPSAAIAEKPPPPKDITAVEKGETFVMKNIYFYPGRHFVKNESMAELDKLYQVLAENETMTIRIEGHICCVKNAPDALDEDTFNLSLSTNRAKYIYDYLVQKGIDRERMEYIGFGRSRPLVKEVTAEDEDKNRRVEIRILEK